MFKQTYPAHWEKQWLKIKYINGRTGWLWRNLNAFDEQAAVWIALNPMRESE